MMHRAPWAQLLLTIPVMACGWTFYVAAWKALRHGGANMNSLIALGTGSAFLYSAFETIRGGHEVYFEAAASIIVLILTGRILEARARQSFRGHPQIDGPAAARRAGLARWKRSRSERGCSSGGRHHRRA